MNRSLATFFTKETFCVTTTILLPKLSYSFVGTIKRDSACLTTKGSLDHDEDSAAGRAKTRLEPLSLDHLFRLEEIAFDDRIWKYMLTRVSNRNQLESWIQRCPDSQSSRADDLGDGPEAGRPYCRIYTGYRP